VMTTLARWASASRITSLLCASERAVNTYLFFTYHELKVLNFAAHGCDEKR
jgi:hypothetical protein